MSRLVKFDAVRVGELSVNFMSPSPALTAKAAFVSNQNGATYGWTTGGNWSQETLARLALLRESMEEDLEKAYFDDGTGVSPTSSNLVPMGLGEYFGGVPQA